MTPHATDCSCHDCETALARLFGAERGEHFENARWAAGLILLRRELGLTQTQLAERAGFPSATCVCEIESGKRPFSLRTLRRLGVLLGLDTVGTIRRLEHRPGDDDDLIDEDPPFDAEQEEEAMRELADVAESRRRQLERARAVVVERAFPLPCSRCDRVRVVLAEGEVRHG